MASKNPTCNSCGRKLDQGPAIGSRTLFMGVVCAFCKKIECSQCKVSNNTAPCKWCRGEVRPAYDTYL